MRVEFEISYDPKQIEQQLKYCTVYPQYRQVSLDFYDSCNREEIIPIIQEALNTLPTNEWLTLSVYTSFDIERFPELKAFLVKRNFRPVDAMTMRWERLIHAIYPHF